MADRKEETAVRIVEREAPAAREARGDGRDANRDVVDIERRLRALHDDVSELASIADQARSNLAPVRLAPFGYNPGQPLVGFAGGLGAEALTTRDWRGQPALVRQPAVNLVDAGEELVLQVELPGVRKRDLELLASERTITLAAQARQEPEASSEGTVLVGEFAPVVYRRTIPLPAACNTGRSQASLKDGWLTLRIPKKDPSAGLKRIDVAYG